MADDESKDEESGQPPEPSDIEPEPEGGPAQRQREFLEERMARAVPKEDDEEIFREGPRPRTEDEGAEISEAPAFEAPEAAEAEEEVEAFRPGAVEEYRERQRAHPPEVLEEAEMESAAEDETVGP